MIYFLRYILTIPLIPASYALFIIFLRITFFSIEFSIYLGAGFFCAGVYLVIKRRIGRVYVFLHELNHLIWSVMSGIKVRKFSVSREGGQLEVEKMNVIAALAPYFFPIPLAGFALMHAFAQTAYSANLHFFALQYVIAGFVFGWHVITTCTVIFKGQQEIRQVGLIYSLIVIFTMFFFFSGLCFSIISPKFCLADFFRLSYKETIAVYSIIFKLIFNTIL